MYKNEWTGNSIREQVSWSSWSFPGRSLYMSGLSSVSSLASMTDRLESIARQNMWVLPLQCFNVTTPYVITIMTMGWRYTLKFLADKKLPGPCKNKSTCVFIFFWQSSCRQCFILPPLWEHCYTAVCPVTHSDLIDGSLLSPLIQPLWSPPPTLLLLLLGVARCLQAGLPPLPVGHGVLHHLGHVLRGGAAGAGRAAGGREGGAPRGEPSGQSPLPNPSILSVMLF